MSVSRARQREILRATEVNTRTVRSPRLPFFQDAPYYKLVVRALFEIAKKGGSPRFSIFDEHRLCTINTTVSGNVRTVLILISEA